MEHVHPQPDRRLLRAARSLHYNRLKAATAVERSERAEELIRSWLDLSGHTQAMLGFFHVALEDGELAVTKVASPDATQLPLPGEELAAYHVPRGLPAPALRIAEISPPARAERLSGLSEGELATLARGMLSALAAAELAPLLARHDAGVTISSPGDAAALLFPEMSALSQEQLRVVTLSTRHAVLGNHLVYQGTVNSAPVRTAEVYRPAVLQQATGIIVAHNHPSGDPAPSSDDYVLTRNLATAGKLLGIGLIDHVVIAASGFYSFREHGHLSHDSVSHNTLSDPVSSPMAALDDRRGT